MFTVYVLWREDWWWNDSAVLCDVCCVCIVKGRLVMGWFCSVMWCLLCMYCEGKTGDGMILLCYVMFTVYVLWREDWWWVDSAVLCNVYCVCAVKGRMVMEWFCCVMWCLLCMCCEGKAGDGMVPLYVYVLWREDWWWDDSAVLCDVCCVCFVKQRLVLGWFCCVIRCLPCMCCEATLVLGWFCCVMRCLLCMFCEGKTGDGVILLCYTMFAVYVLWREDWWWDDSAVLCEVCCLCVVKGRLVMGWFCCVMWCLLCICWEGRLVMG